MERCPFFNWVVFIFVTEMDNKTLSPVGFTNMFTHSVRYFHSLDSCALHLNMPSSPLLGQTTLPEGSSCVCFIQPSPWLIIGVQKGMVTSWIKSSFVLISPVTFLVLFLTHFLNVHLFSLIETVWLGVTDVHLIAHLCLSIAFILNLSVVCCYWPLEICFSLFPESLVHPIRSLVVVRVASLLHLPYMRGVKCLSGNCPSISVISCTPSVDNSKLSLALPFLLSSDATFSNTQWAIEIPSWPGGSKPFHVREPGPKCPPDQEDKKS